MGGHTSPTVDNTYDLGDPFLRWDNVRATNGTIQTSDRREKTEITSSSLGLSFINKLNPVSYKWIVSKNVVQKDSDGNIIYNDVNKTNPKTTSTPGVRTHYGLIAQEVKATLDELSITDFAGWALTDKDDSESKQSLRYHEFIAPMMKAIQELSEKNTALEARIATLEGS